MGTALEGGEGGELDAMGGGSVKQKGLREGRGWLHHKVDNGVNTLSTDTCTSWFTVDPV